MKSLNHELLPVLDFYDKKIALPEKYPSVEEYVKVCPITGERSVLYLWELPPNRRMPSWTF